MNSAPMKSLTAMATEKVLLKCSGKEFLDGIGFMKAAGIAPDRISIMCTRSNKYILKFFSSCDIRPFACNYASFYRVLRGLVHIRAWCLKSIEFVNIPFNAVDILQLEKTMEKLGVELILLRNCSYPGLQYGQEARRFLSALNRKNKTVVCEYGDDRLKSRLHDERPSSRRTTPRLNGPAGRAQPPNVAGPRLRHENGAQNVDAPEVMGNNFS